PIFSAIPNRGNRVTDEVSFTVSASDGDQDALLYSASGLPSGITIRSSDGYISGTVSTVGVWNVTVSATDGYGTGSTTFVWTTTVNKAPALTSIPTQVNRTTDTVSLQAMASDGDADPIAYRAEGLPNGLSINPVTGLISGVIISPGSGITTIYAADAYVEVSTSFDWVVTNNNVPTIADIPNQSYRITDALDLPLDVGDEDGDPLQIEATGLPNGIALSDNKLTGVFTTAGSFSTEISVTDGYDEVKTTISWSITANQLPRIAAITEQRYRLTETVGIELTITDSDGDPISTSVSGLPPGLSFDGSRSRISGAPTAVGSFQTMVTAEDGYGISNATIDWVISRNQAPTIA
ncbi:MAG: hypothetical protein EB075_15395, partial [Bacteroidetes bacterium]|nr:hypothetical protein [Bacteroidota bacterium]